jgi:hypothetical protein
MVRHQHKHGQLEPEELPKGKHGIASWDEFSTRGVLAYYEVERHDGQVLLLSAANSPLLLLLLLGWRE